MNSYEICNISSYQISSTNQLYFAVSVSIKSLDVACSANSRTECSNEPYLFGVPVRPSCTELCRFTSDNSAYCLSSLTSTVVECMVEHMMCQVHIFQVKVECASTIESKLTSRIMCAIFKEFQHHIGSRHI